MRRLILGLGAATALAAAGAAGGAAGAPPRPTFDLILAGGTVYPGEAAPFTGDVAITGDRIV